MQAYHTLLRNPKWQRRRLEIFERDGWRCRSCQDDQAELQVHHRWYAAGKMPWEYPDEVLLTLCKSCHEHISQGRGPTMTASLPMLVRKETLSLRDGQSVFAAFSSTGRMYLDGDALTRKVALMHKGDERLDQVLMNNYLVQHEGEAYRKSLQEFFKEQGETDPETAVWFADSAGIRWWVIELALHFVSIYDKQLQVYIIHFFAMHAMPGGGFNCAITATVAAIYERGAAITAGLEGQPHIGAGYCGPR